MEHGGKNPRHPPRWRFRRPLTPPVKKASGGADTIPAKRGEGRRLRHTAASRNNAIPSHGRRVQDV